MIETFNEYNTNMLRINPEVMWGVRIVNVRSRTPSQSNFWHILFAHCHTAISTIGWHPSPQLTCHDMFREAHNHNGVTTIWYLTLSVEKSSYRATIKFSVWMGDHKAMINTIYTYATIRSAGKFTINLLWCWFIYIYMKNVYGDSNTMNNIPLPRFTAKNAGGPLISKHSIVCSHCLA